MQSEQGPPPDPTKIITSRVLRATRSHREIGTTILSAKSLAGGTATKAIQRRSSRLRAFILQVEAAGSFHAPSQAADIQPPNFSPPRFKTWKTVLR